MAKITNWGAVAIASFAAAWVLIAMGMFGGLSPDPWAWISLALGLWPVFYFMNRFLL